MQSADKYSKNKELIMSAQGDDEKAALAATEELILVNMGLVRSIAMRFRDRGTEVEDLIQIGTIGMIKAVRSFDTEREVVFSTYAVPLISGEIKRFLRDDGMVKVSRSLKENGWKRGLSLRGQEKVLLRYNRSTTYARTILALAQKIRQIEQNKTRR